MQTQNTYKIETQNGMILVHDNKVNNIDEWNLLHEILNHPKRIKN